MLTMFRMIQEKHKQQNHQLTNQNHTQNFKLLASSVSPCQYDLIYIIQPFIRHMFGIAVRI